MESVQKCVISIYQPPIWQHHWNAWIRETTMSNRMHLQEKLGGAGPARPSTTWAGGTTRPFRIKLESWLDNKVPNAMGTAVGICLLHGFAEAYRG